MKKLILIAFLLIGGNAISQNIVDSTSLKKDTLTGVYTTPDIEVSDYVQKTAFDKIIEMSYSLSGKDLQRNMNTTLAATIKNEMGMSMRSMGPAPSRPVFRGLSGERITISEDGIKTNDLSSTSPDHSVALETFTVEKIEVLRGPKLLTKSPTNVGAVINAIRNEIPQELPDKININFGTYGESVNSGFSSSLVIKAPVLDFSLRGEISNRNTGNQKTPSGTLLNSGINTFNYSGGLSYIKNKIITGISYREFKTDYGIPGGFIGAHPFGVNIAMKKKQINFKLKYDVGSKYLENIEAEFSRVNYNHKEFEKSGLIGAEFGITNYSADILFNHKTSGKIKSGIAGISFNHRDFDIGGFVFTTPAKSLNLSAFVYENIVINDKLSVELSLRYNYDEINPRDKNYNSSIGYITNKIYNTLSAGASAVYRIFRNHYAGINLVRSTRVPTIEELYSEGPHLAAYSYEIGNPNLKSELAYGGELFTYYRSENLYVMLSGYYNDFPNFIIPRNTGKINYATLLPIYATEGVPAILTGFETQLEFKPFKFLQLDFNASYTYGKFNQTGTPLPAIPPFKIISSLSYKRNNFLFGVINESASKQLRLDTFEEATDGYSIFGIFSQYILRTGKLIHNISANIDNIFNTEYRNHLSRVKSIMPEPGRNFRVIYRLFF